MKEILEQLFENQDIPYGEFTWKLMPGAPRETVIGVRTPVLRQIAKEFSKKGNTEMFFRELPHDYFEERQVHAFLIGEIKDFDRAIREIDRFLPYVDNWATCDQLRVRCFSKNHKKLLPHVERWMASSHLYTCRFGIGMLMCHYLDQDFEPVFLKWVADIRSEEYYLNMMIAWFFATALAKQYEAALPYLEQHKLAPWTHNKAIQKAIESFRVTEDAKAYLRTLKINNKNARNVDP